MTNLVEVNFLDFTFKLRNGSYRPSKKPNDEFKYINVLSNHPPQILKQLTTTISDRLLRNLSSELIFDEWKHQYEDTMADYYYILSNIWVSDIWPHIGESGLVG